MVSVCYVYAINFTQLCLCHTSCKAAVDFCFFSHVCVQLSWLPLNISRCLHVCNTFVKFMKLMQFSPNFELDIQVIKKIEKPKKN